MNLPTPIQFPMYPDINGILCVFESGRYVPFEIRRVFTVSARSGDIRGDHAHRKCTQLLVCVSGKIRVTCDNGAIVTKHCLDNMGTGLLIPPGIWAKEDYLEDGAVLMVLCDRGYEEEDYLREYEEFKTFLVSKEPR